MKKILLLIIFFISVTGCEDAPIVNINKEELFTLSFGRMENQIDLFQIEGVPFNKKNLIYMRDGKIYISNGNVSKVMEFTAYGDLVSLLYNSSYNTKPFILSSGDEAELTNRLAQEYPFINIGNIAIDGQKNLYVVDEVPREQREYDENNLSEYFQRVLRFNKYGELIDFFGQEGVGGRGTPFPYIDNIFISSRNELVVVTKTSNNLNNNVLDNNYIIFWFSNNGDILYKFELSSGNMPSVETLIPCIDKIVIDYNNREVVIMVSYLEKIIEESTGMYDLKSNKLQRIYHYSPEKKGFIKEITIPDTLKQQEWVGMEEGMLPLYDFIGITINGYYFLLRPQDQNQKSLLILDNNGNIHTVRNILINDSDIYYNNLYLSRKGIIIGLLCYFRQAKVVWWRSDKLISEF